MGRSVRKQETLFSDPFKTALMQFAGLLEATQDDPSREVFTNAISNAVNRYNLKPADIIKFSKASKGTVSKWISGDAAPHHDLKGRLIEWMAQRCREMADEL